MIQQIVIEASLGSGRRLDLVVRNDGDAPQYVGTVDVPLGPRPDRVMEHGWQSWSVVRPCWWDDVRPERRDAPSRVRGMHVADPAGAGAVVSGDQFLVHNRGVAGWLDGRRALGTVVATATGLVARALLEVELAPGEERQLDPLWVAAGDPGAVYSEYASHWGAVAGARCDAHAPVGWCSWYQYFHDVTAEDVRANLALAAEHGLELVQIDDGYQSAIGDWLTTCDRFPDGMATLADEISSAGLTPGIWTAPFLAGADSQLAREHPDWLLQHASGTPLRALRQDMWGGWVHVLDTTHPDVLDHLRSMYAALRAQGFSYHKIDFCFAAALVGTRHDSRVTRAQALRAGLEAVREGIGDDAFLLGCGCPFGQAVGVVDAMRVSADVAPWWEPKDHWPGFRESVPSASNAIIASRLRSPLHRRVFINDPDCLLLRPEQTQLSAQERRLLADTIVSNGAFLIVSDDMRLYGKREWKRLAALRAAVAAADHPLDLADPLG